MTSDIDGNYRGVYTYGIERLGVEDLGNIEGKPNNPLYYLSDTLGSTIAITNMNAGVIDSNRFGPYGEPLDPVAKNARLTNSPYGFTGEMHDIEGDLLYLRARYYEPATMRFLQQDTVLGDINDPLSRNLYTYAQGNPLKYVDPSGHEILKGHENLDDKEAPVTNPSYNPQTKEYIYKADVIKKGDKGSKVVGIQRMLNSLKHEPYKLQVDGSFGPATLKAVSTFKNDNGIYNKGDWRGVVDHKTRNILVAKSNAMINTGEEVFTDAKKNTNPVESPPITNKATNNIDAKQQMVAKVIDSAIKVKKVTKPVSDFTKGVIDSVDNNITFGLVQKAEEYIVPLKQQEKTTSYKVGKAVGSAGTTLYGIVKTGIGITEALVGGIGGPALAPATGGGSLAMGGAIAADGVIRAAHGATVMTISSSNLGKDIKDLLSGEGSTKPNQVHHFLTNKSKVYTKQIEKITKKYGLDLNGAWNKAPMPHQGRHANAYHDYMLEQIKQIDDVAQGDKDLFLELFEQVKQKVIDNPDILYKDYWR